MQVLSPRDESHETYSTSPDVRAGLGKHSEPSRPLLTIHKVLNIPRAENERINTQHSYDLTSLTVEQAEAQRKVSEDEVHAASLCFLNRKRKRQECHEIKEELKKLKSVFEDVEMNKQLCMRLLEEKERNEEETILIMLGYEFSSRFVLNMNDASPDSFLSCCGVCSRPVSDGRDTRRRHSPPLATASKSLRKGILRSNSCFKKCLLARVRCKLFENKSSDMNEVELDHYLAKLCSNSRNNPCFKLGFRKGLREHKESMINTRKCVLCESQLSDRSICHVLSKMSLLSESLEGKR